MTPDSTQREPTTAEKFTDSVWTRLVARASMMAVLPMLSLVTWLGSQWIESRIATPLAEIREDIDQLKTSDGIQNISIGTHEARIAGNKEIIGKIEQKIDDLGSQLQDNNTSLQRLIGAIERDQRTERTQR